MHQVNLTEAATQLAILIEKVVRGEEVIITRSDGKSFQIVPISTPKPRPRFGSAKGLVKMSDDFDDLLADFQDYYP